MSAAVIDYMYGDNLGIYYGYPPRTQPQVRKTVRCARLWKERTLFKIALKAACKKGRR